MPPRRNLYVTKIESFVTMCFVTNSRCCMRQVLNTNSFMHWTLYFVTGKSVKVIRFICIYVYVCINVRARCFCKGYIWLYSSKNKHVCHEADTCLPPIWSMCVIPRYHDKVILSVVHVQMRYCPTYIFLYEICIVIFHQEEGCL